MITESTIEGLWVIERPTHPDTRGFVREPFRLGALEAAVGSSIAFVQQNHARTVGGALRGHHAEDWEKLIYVPRGRVFQVVADIRAESRTFGCVATFEIGDNNHLSLFLPRGVANGYCVLTEEADYMYLVTRYYDGSDTRAVRWDDPDLAVPWPISKPVLSERDQHNPSLRELLPDAFARKE